VCSRGMCCSSFCWCAVHARASEVFCCRAHHLTRQQAARRTCLLVHPEGLDYREELLKAYAHYGVTLVFNHCAPLR
jgi:hypothetical protein